MGGDHGGGNDGNANGGSSANKLVKDCFSKPMLAGGSSFSMQLGALSRCNVVEDLSFRESTVKDMTDRGRSGAAQQIEQALKEAASAKRSQRGSKRKSEHLGKGATLSSSSSSSAASVHDKAEEAELRREVRTLLQKLQGFRAGRLSERVAAHALQQLDLLQVTVSCLKSTKIAAELNLPSWRHDDTPGQIRYAAKSLVNRWRSMYKKEKGDDDDDSLPPSMLARVSRIVSMDVEESASAASNGSKTVYPELIDGILAVIAKEPATAVSLLTGSSVPKDIVDRCIRSVTLRANSDKSNQRLTKLPPRQ